jgi:hypothetical protein
VAQGEGLFSHESDGCYSTVCSAINHLKPVFPSIVNKTQQITIPLKNNPLLASRKQMGFCLSTVQEKATHSYEKE